MVVVERCLDFVCLLCFFFSSRRRHTRLQGDWSPDVCSSDLMRDVEVAGATATVWVLWGLDLQPSLVLTDERRRFIGVLDADRLVLPSSWREHADRKSVV